MGDTMIQVINTDTVLTNRETALSCPVSVLMSDTMINQLISIRDQVTSQIPNWFHQASIVDEIDALLQQVPPGQRNDVDLLLGRACAALPKMV